MEENLQGPINPHLFEDGYFGGECLEQENSNASSGYWTTSYQMFGNSKYRFNFQEEAAAAAAAEIDLRIPGFDDKMSFLQILQSVGSNNETHIVHPPTQTGTPIWARDVQSPQLSDNTTAQIQHPYCISVVNLENSTSPAVQTMSPISNARKRRKQNQSKPPKDKEEVENQRMTHITVERNRRRQMNNHFSALRSLMPLSYVKRGDQASIVGGAINYIKELEQILESLQDPKRMRKFSANTNSGSSSVYTNTTGDEINIDEDDEVKVKVKVKVIVVQKHVNMKIRIASNGEKRGASEVVRAIVEFQRLRLTVLHLNITTLQTSLHFSFSLKIEDDCSLESADEIAGAVHQIFN